MVERSPLARLQHSIGRRLLRSLCALQRLGVKGRLQLGKLVTRPFRAWQKCQKSSFKKFRKVPIFPDLPTDDGVARRNVLMSIPTIPPDLSIDLTASIVSCQSCVVYTTFVGNSVLSFTTSKLNSEKFAEHQSTKYHQACMEPADDLKRRIEYGPASQARGHTDLVHSLLACGCKHLCRECKLLVIRESTDY